MSEFASDVSNRETNIKFKNGFDYIYKKYSDYWLVKLLNHGFKYGILHHP